MTPRYIDVKMPWLAPEEPLTEVVRWLADLGQKLEMDQDLLELTVDSAVFMLPSPVDGKLVRCCVAPKEVVSEGQILAVVQCE